MNKALKRAGTGLMVLLMSLSLCTAAYGENSVEYRGGAEKFLFAQGSEYSESDLFGSFKNLFPGDKVSQTISVKNGSDGPDSVKIYLRAVPHGAENPLSAHTQESISDMEEFLSCLHMTVENNGKVIYDTSPDSTGTLTDNVLLGDFPKGSSTELKLTLSVPVRLGNDYADRLGEVDWVFTAQQTGKQDRPKTGDESLWWALLSAQSLAMALGLMKLLKRKN